MTFQNLILLYITTWMCVSNCYIFPILFSLFFPYFFEEKWKMWLVDYTVVKPRCQGQSTVEHSKPATSKMTSNYILSYFVKKCSFGILLSVPWNPVS